LAPAWTDDRAADAEAEILEADADSEFTDLVEAELLLWP
jgi:hypothetical protein